MSTRSTSYKAREHYIAGGYMYKFQAKNRENLSNVFITMQLPMTIRVQQHQVI